MPGNPPASVFQKIKAFLFKPIYFDRSTLSFHFDQKFKRLSISKKNPKKYRLAVVWFLFVNCYIFLSWKSGIGVERALNDNSSYGFSWVLISSIPVCICLCFVLFWIKRREKLTWGQTLEKLGYQNPDPWQIRASMLLVLLLATGYAVYIGVNLRMGVPVAMARYWPARLLDLIITAGIFEETFYRGFLFQFLRKGRSFFAAAALSGILWSLGHVLDLAGGVNEESLGKMCGSMITAILISIPLCFIFERGKNVIWGGMIVHLALDFGYLLNLGEHKTTYYFGALNIIQWSTVMALAVITLPVVDRMIPVRAKKKNFMQMVEVILNPTQKKNVHWPRRWFWFGTAIGFALSSLFMCFLSVGVVAHQALTQFRKTPVSELVQTAGNYYLNHEYEKSRIAYEIVLETDPNNYDAHYFLASLYSLYLWPVNYPKAAQHIQTALKLRMTMNNLMVYGWLLFKEEKWQESEKIFRQYLDKKGYEKDPEAWKDLAIVLAKESKTQEAQNALEIAQTVTLGFKRSDEVIQGIKNLSLKTNPDMKIFILFPEQ